MCHTGLPQTPSRGTTRQRRVRSPREWGRILNVEHGSSWNCGAVRVAPSRRPYRCCGGVYMVSGAAAVVSGSVLRSCSNPSKTCPPCTRWTGFRRICEPPDRLHGRPGKKRKACSRDLFAKSSRKNLTNHIWNAAWAYERQAPSGLGAISIERFV